MEFEKYEDVPENILQQNTKQKIIRETMFDSHYSPEILEELSKCLRVMPHHQNTSGFFITIFQKLKEFDGAKLTQKDPITKPLPLEIQKIDQTKAFNFLRVDPTDPDL